MTDNLDERAARLVAAVAFDALDDLLDKSGEVEVLLPHMVAHFFHLRLTAHAGTCEDEDDAVYRAVTDVMGIFGQAVRARFDLYEEGFSVLALLGQHLAGLVLGLGGVDHDCDPAAYAEDYLSLVRAQ